MDKGDSASSESFTELKSRHDLVALIYSLHEEIEANPERWDNRTLSSYLRALAAFLNDAQGYYDNAKLNVSADVPSWRLFADCLSAASIYD